MFLKFLDEFALKVIAACSVFEESFWCNLNNVYCED